MGFPYLETLPAQQLLDSNVIDLAPAFGQGKRTTLSLKTLDPLLDIHDYGCGVRSSGVEKTRKVLNLEPPRQSRKIPETGSSAQRPLLNYRYERSLLDGTLNEFA